MGYDNQFIEVIAWSVYMLIILMKMAFSLVSDDTMSFVLEEEVKLQQELLTHLQDQLTKKR